MSTVMKRKFTIMLTATVYDNHGEARMMPVKVAVEAEDEFQAVGIIEATLRRVAQGPF